jgi:hypothetical protein
MEANSSKEMRDEMVGILTAISIVSKRMAERLKEQTEEPSGELDGKDEEGDGDRVIYTSASGTGANKG